MKVVRIREIFGHREQLRQSHSQFRAMVVSYVTKLYIQCSINDSKLQIQISFKPLLQGLQIDGIQDMFHMEFMHFMMLDPYCFTFAFILALLTFHKFIFYIARINPSSMFTYKNTTYLQSPRNANNQPIFYYRYDITNTSYNMFRPLCAIIR
jgi:hypothetical protein